MGGFHYRPRRIAMVVTLLSLISGAAAGGHPAHYLVLKVDETGTVEPLFHRYVDLTEPLESLSEDELTALEVDSRGTVLSLLLRDAEGLVRFRQAFHLEPWIRGEFHSRSGSDKSHTGC